MAIGWFLLAWILLALLIALVIRAAWMDRLMEIREDRIVTPVYAAEAEPTPTATPAPAPRFARYPVPLDDELQQYIIRTAREYEVDPCIVFAVIGVETGGTYDPSLIGDGGHSFGLMQIYSTVHAERIQRLEAWDLLDPYQNVLVGIDLLAELLDFFDGDMDKALSFYHGNGGAADPYALTVQQNAECLLESVQMVEG